MNIKTVIRYTTPTIAPLIADIGISNLLAYALNLPLLIAGVGGLLATAITNYFFFLKVTFKDRALSASWNSLIKYLKTYLIAIVTRILALTALGWFSGFSSFVSLLIATGLSFGVNYALSRFYVFRHKS